MRITSGRLKGRALDAPAGLGVRPTSDKVRQAIFNVLEHHDFGTGFQLEGARVIDLFAGTGALSLEALSRGARYALLIDSAHESRAYQRRNIEAMGLTGITKIWKRDATDLGKNTGDKFDLAFLDPPYRQSLLSSALQALHGGGWLQAGALVVAEMAAGEDRPSTEEFVLLDDRAYGETRISFLSPR
jgi:16S rRNA (guanine966-N2)-methyltransferase